MIFVFSLDSEASFSAVYNYHAKMAQFRNAAEIPCILVGTQGEFWIGKTFARLVPSDF